MVAYVLSFGFTFVGLVGGIAMYFKGRRAIREAILEDLAEAKKAEG